MENQEKNLWQKNKWILYLGIVVIIASFFLDRCNNSEPSSVQKTTSVKVVTPEVKGDFTAKTPVHKPIVDVLPVNNNGNIDKSDNFLVQNLIAENKRLLQNYNKQTDSLKKKLYEQAIQLNSFSVPFEDDNIKIEMSGIVQGKVKSVKPTYTIKPKTIPVDVPVKEKVFTLRAGGEYGNTIELNKSVFKGNLEFENKKGNSFSYGYDTNKTHWLGVKITVFSIKK